MLFTQRHDILCNITFIVWFKILYNITFIVWFKKVTENCKELAASSSNISTAGCGQEIPHEALGAERSLEGTQWDLEFQSSPVTVLSPFSKAVLILILR